MKNTKNDAERKKKKIKVQHLIALSCAGIILLRIAIPSVKFDEISLILFVLGVLVLLMPEDFLRRETLFRLKWPL